MIKICTIKHAFLSIIEKDKNNKIIQKSISWKSNKSRVLRVNFVQNMIRIQNHFSPALPLSIQEMWGHSEKINDNFLKLFIKDEKQPGKYFPKIGAKDEPEYKSLSPLERNTFDRLYEDFFYHRHNQFWYDEAMKKLPALTGSLRDKTSVQHLR